MTLVFPSMEFDDAVAAVCHGTATETEMRALNELLRRDGAARDEYLLRVEVHSRLASEPAAFTQAQDAACLCPLPAPGGRPSQDGQSVPLNGRTTNRGSARALALAASLVFVTAGVWYFWFARVDPDRGLTSTAVAMLTRTVDARWAGSSDPPRTGSPLEPGWLKLESGLAQVVFYSGARVVIEGPAEMRLVSPSEAVCRSGRLLAEVPRPARGFRLRTGQLNVLDLGTAFGVAATPDRTEVHVFQGEVALTGKAAPRQSLHAGQATAACDNAPWEPLEASEAAFGALFELQQRSLASETLRYDQWRLWSARHNEDPSLVVRLDFEAARLSAWTVANAAERNRSVPDATIVGCRQAEGRWREKPALQFQSVNDRVRLVVPGEFDSLTLSAWVSVNALDRQFNSLLMCDGFEPGTIHWLIRHDGVLGLTVIGLNPGDYQIVRSPPVVTPNRLGTWLHLAVVLDGPARKVTHYVNGTRVASHALRIEPPFRLGPGELGNWNVQAGPEPAPFLIRHLSGCLDEFALFNRPLSHQEIQELYSRGSPENLMSKSRASQEVPVQSTPQTHVGGLPAMDR